jgi:hypothetical protein
MIAKTILEKYLEYTCYWEAKFSAGIPPSELIQRQLAALMKAVEIFPEKVSKRKKASFINYLSSGRFLEQNTHSKTVVAPLLEKYIDASIKESMHSSHLDGLKEYADYREIFQKLLNYRTKIERLYVPSGGIRLEGFGSFGSHFFSLQKKKVLDKLKEATKEMDEILCLLIDPQQREISEETLISEFDYPTEDLRQVANSWFADGF